MFTSFAYAMGQSGGAGGDAAGLASFVPLILMFAVFYFLLIRPQQKRTKEHKAMLDSLKRGDEVVAGGGIYGRIVECADDYVILDVGDAELKMARASVSAMLTRGKSETAAKGRKDSGKSGQGKSGTDKKGRNDAAGALKDSGDEAPHTEKRRRLSLRKGSDEAAPENDDAPADKAEGATSADRTGEAGASADEAGAAGTPADK
jgi:preprotein translocase subunit YajC